MDNPLDEITTRHAESLTAALFAGACLLFIAIVGAAAGLFFALRALF